METPLLNRPDADTCRGNFAPLFCLNGFRIKSQRLITIRLIYLSNKHKTYNKHTTYPTSL